MDVIAGTGVMPRTATQRLGRPAIAMAAPIVSTRPFWGSAALKNPLLTVATFNDTPIGIKLCD